MLHILEKIHLSGLKLLAAKNKEEMYACIVHEAIKLVSAEFGALFIYKEDMLLRVYASEPFLYELKPRPNGIISQALKKQKLIFNDSQEFQVPVREAGIRSIIIIPLAYENEILGVFIAYAKKQNEFDKEDLGLLQLFGSMASLAVKRITALSETKKALEIRDMFISMAAHELRTPLTSISGYIQLLYTKLGNHEGVEGKWMRALYEENKRMTNLVKELLEFNRMKTGNIQFVWQECSMLQVLKEAVKEMHETYPARELVFENNIPHMKDTVIGDAGKLAKVFVNIVDNAIKYSPKTTRVIISASQQQGIHIITIKDFGRGIAKEDIEHIFEGHHKAESGEEGMGIGLYFVDGVIRQHRGSISVTSELKRGTTFEVHLPVAQYN